MPDIFAHPLGANGIKEISRGNSEGKLQVIKFANYAKSRSSLFIFSKRDDDFSHVECIARVSTSFAALLLAVRTSTSRSLRHPKK